MKTKKLLVVLLIALMIASSACGKSDNSNTTSTQADVSESDTVSEASELTAPVDEDSGKVLSCDITNKGTVSDQGPALGTFAFISDGETYTLPIQVKSLTDKGLYHKISEAENSFKGKQTTQLVSKFSFYKKVNNEESPVFSIFCFYNSSDENQPVDNCLLTGASFYQDSADWILPGGITKQSTAADVLRIYGAPGKNANAPFVNGRVGKLSTDAYLKYTTADKTEVEFYFNVDGTIEHCCIFNERMQ